MKGVLMNSSQKIILSTCIICHLFAQSPGDFYSTLSSLTNPTFEDYILIQDFVTSYNAPYIKNYVDWKGRPKPREISIIDKSINDISRELITVKVMENKIENCIYIYSRINPLQIYYAQTLIEAIKSSGYKGHIIFQKGGWPNLEEGDLIFAHIPHAYKLCALREVRRLGYKKVLWLDANLLPVINLNKVFRIIGRKCVFSYKSKLQLKMLFHDREYIKLFNLSQNNMNRLYVIYSSIIGLDLTDRDAQDFIDDWTFECLYNEKSCFSQFAESALVSKILNDYFDEKNFNYKINHIDVDRVQDLEFTTQIPPQEILDQIAQGISP